MPKIDLCEFTRIMKEDWENKILDNEWHFAHCRQTIADQLMPWEAFEMIPEAVDIVLSENDEDPYVRESVYSILFLLCSTADTTERPEYLIEKWGELKRKFSDLGEDEFMKWLSDYYRIK